MLMYGDIITEIYKNIILIYRFDFTNVTHTIQVILSTGIHNRTLTVTRSIGINGFNFLLVC